MAEQRPTVFSLAEFMEAEIEPERFVLEPWLPEQGLAMIAGPTGIGKTFLSLACALAIAGGWSVCGWKAGRPQRVLYVDGEMALTDMQARCRDMLRGFGGSTARAADNLFFICANAQENGLKSIVSHQSVRKQIEWALDYYEAKVMFLDNLSALCNSEAENDVESWTVMQEWLLKLRRKGITVVFLHHTGKPDQFMQVKQRGTSKREDVLNTSIILRPDKDGMDFRVDFTKHRGFLPVGEIAGKVVWNKDTGICRIEHEHRLPKKKLSKAQAEELAPELG